MSNDSKTPDFIFKKDNYIWLIASIAFIVFGFILMSGGGSEDPNKFSEAIFSDRRITIAPALVLIGFGIGFYAILKKPKE